MKNENRKRRGSALKVSVLFSLVLALFAAWPCPAQEDTADCDAKEALRRMREDPDMAEETMSLTIRAMIKHLRCNISGDLVDQAAGNPLEAERLIASQAPDCYLKMYALQSGETEDNRAILLQVVADVVETQMADDGCHGVRSDIEELIEFEYQVRDMERNYLRCIGALHRVKSALRFYYNEHGHYTADMEELYSVLAMGLERSAEVAEQEIGESCCAAPGCDPDDPEEAWSAAFGIEIPEEDYDYLIYGYPVGGPDCLIMITPERDDPETFEACYQESEEDKQDSE